MKHKFKIEPRGKKSKYYICERCGLRLVGTSLKEIKEYERVELEGCRRKE
jgi:hypothetical protein